VVGSYEHGNETCGFHKRRRISLLAELLSASKDGLCSLESVQKCQPCQVTPAAQERNINLNYQIKVWPHILSNSYSAIAFLSLSHQSLLLPDFFLWFLLFPSLFLTLLPPSCSSVSPGFFLHFRRPTCLSVNRALYTTSRQIYTLPPASLSIFIIAITSHLYAYIVSSIWQTLCLSIKITNRCDESRVKSVARTSCCSIKRKGSDVSSSSQQEVQPRNVYLRPRAWVTLAEAEMQLPATPTKVCVTRRTSTSISLKRINVTSEHLAYSNVFRRGRSSFKKEQNVNFVT
jgi:hypothetical protein